MVRPALLLFGLTASLQAQLIPVKTVPIAQGNQFQLFPSANLGMGSVSIALSDPAFDPFVNPATGSRLDASRLFASPVVYSVTRETGGGRSLPLALLARRANWYGGVAVVAQQVDPSQPPQPDNRVIAVAELRGAPDPILPPSGQFVQPDRRAHGNRYVFGMLGRSIPGSHLSIGASVLWNGLHAVDGVDLLYANSRRLAQAGHSLDLRVGVLKEWPQAGDAPAARAARAARAFEAVLVHNRLSATHDVTYADRFWNPNLQLFEEQARLERHFERTSTWGLQLNYQMPLAATGWRIGWLAVANRSSHPKIPNYDLANVPPIPREPGYTHAFNLGVGVSKVERTGAGRFAIDLVYEPISSYTWEAATAPLVTAAGDSIPAGGKTVENRFRFSNAWLRVGVEQPIAPDNPTQFQLGLILHPIQYWLRQTDHVQQLSRRLSSGWVEWTPTWGISHRQPGYEIRYQGRATKGASRPQQQFFGGFGGFDLAPRGSSFIGPVPDGRVLMTDVTTVTHQISVALPLR